MFVILGANGKVGRASAQALRDQGRPVRAVLRDPAKAAPLEAMGCGIAIADLADPAATARAMADATAVQVLCPMMPQADDARTAMDSLVDRLAEALELARPARIVALSDYGAQVPEGTGITLVFHQMEARLGRLPGITFLRSAEHMDNWSRMVAFASGSGMLPSMHHPLTKRFPMVAAADVGRIAADLLADETAARIVHVEGPRRHTPVEVAETLERVLGRPVSAVATPRADWPTALVRAGLGTSYADLVVALYDAHNAGRIDAETGGEVRRGTTELADVLAGLRR